MYEWRACSISHCITQVLSLAKGFRGRSKNCIRIARERVEKALQYAYRGSQDQEARHAVTVDTESQRSLERAWGVPLNFCSLPLAWTQPHIDGLSNVQV